MGRWYQRNGFDRCPVLVTATGGGGTAHEELAAPDPNPGQAKRGPGAQVSQTFLLRCSTEGWQGINRVQFGNLGRLYKELGRCDVGENESEEVDGGRASQGLL